MPAAAVGANRTAAVLPCVLPGPDAVYGGERRGRCRTALSDQHCSGRVAGVTAGPVRRERAQGEVASWFAFAAARIRPSAWRGPTICRPIGNPSAVRPHGTVIAGCCVRLNG